MHWVAIYDSLEDDIYDGQLGEDEVHTPRVLLEYSIVGGKYTSVMNNIDKIKGVILASEEAGGPAIVKEKVKQNKEFSLTVEYVESRDEKIKGKSQFSGRIVDMSKEPMVPGEDL